MWIEFNDEEVATLVAENHPALRRRSEAASDPHARTFAAAAEASSRRVHASSEAIVRRDVRGAYVLNWYWVDNVDAGLPSYDNLDDFCISADLQSRLRTIEDFSITDFAPGIDGNLGSGRVGNKWWRVDLTGTHLEFSVFASDPPGDPEWTIGAYLLSGAEDAFVTEEFGLGFVADVIPRFRQDTQAEQIDGVISDNLNHNGKDITSQSLAILCSTHVTQKTWNFLRNCSRNEWAFFIGNFGPNGFILHSRDPDPRTPRDLKDVLKHAVERGYSWVALHEDGETIDGLPIYRT